ncbi:PaaI family thioesterase [Streptomyces sp. NPDC020681]|uniref:PaaI family thioesterase n=1 Tax=Streptomyces sp. NPDC020681 TaxID=3365083 RepID=UPI0037920B7B
MNPMQLDELMGWACAAAGVPGMTVSLQVRHHRPSPTGDSLRVYARVTGTESRKIFVDGPISAEADPSAIAVTAEGVFVSPVPDRTRALFPTTQWHPVRADSGVARGAVARRFPGPGPAHPAGRTAGGPPRGWARWGRSGGASPAW